MYIYSYHKFSVVKMVFITSNALRMLHFDAKSPNFPGEDPAPPAACGVILPLFGASCLSELVTSAPPPPAIEVLHSPGLMCTKQTNEFEAIYQVYAKVNCTQLQFVNWRPRA